MIIDSAVLRERVAGIFAAAGCQRAEAAVIAEHLVLANLVGHDSHGVIRVASYIDWLANGKVLANRQGRVVLDSGPLAIVDGEFGFGQTIGRAAIDLGVAKAREHGVAIVALRNSGHLGRIGDWPARAAQAGVVSLHFVNTSGGGILVAPHGGLDRRLSANPIAAGVPRADGPPLLVDISTCAIAEGKIRVALNSGKQVPEGTILDGQGRPTVEPAVFYADPPGAILPFGGHKGYALSLLCEVLAGALTGGGCSDPSIKRVANSMLSILIDPARFREVPEFQAELSRFTQFVKAARPAVAGQEILLPGEPEERMQRQREAEGIPLDDVTWSQLCGAGERVGFAVAS